jgi:hypothetical protein
LIYDVSNSIREKKRCGSGRLGDGIFVGKACYGMVMVREGANDLFKTNLYVK